MAQDEATLRIVLEDEGDVSPLPSEAPPTQSPPPERVAPPPAASQAAIAPQPSSAPPAPGEVVAPASPASFSLMGRESPEPKPLESRIQEPEAPRPVEPLEPAKRMDPPVAEQPEPAKPQVQIESPPEPPEQAPPSVQPPAPEPAQVAPPPQLDTDHIQQLISEFGRDMAAQILAATGVALPEEEVKAAASAPSTAKRPELVAEDGFDPVKIAEARIERERKARLVEEEYRRLNPPAPELPYDPAAIAKKRIEREEQLEAAEAEYKKLKPPELEFDPVAIAKKRVEREEQIAAADAEYRKLKPPAPEPTFDPVDVAKRRVEREDQLAQAEAEYRKLKPPEPPPPFDPVAAAKKRVERDEQLAAADAEYRKLRPPEAFDAVAEAKKRVEGEDRKAAIDEEYKRLRPPEPEKPFDPFEAAQKSREGALKAERISAAYEAMYGAADKTKDAFDQTLDIADRFRGTVGGVFGTLVGAGLDIAAMVRKEMVPAKSPLRKEAERLNAQAMPRPEMPAPPKPEAAKAEVPKPAPMDALPAKTDSPTPPELPLEVDGKTFDWKDAPDLQKQQQQDASGASAIKDAATSSVTDKFQELAKTVGTASAETGSLAAGAGSASAALGPLGIAATATAIGFTALDRAIAPLIQSYSEYNPQVAMASAMAEVRATFGDIRRSQESGPQLAGYIKAQSEMQQRWEDLKVGLLMKLMPLAEGIMEIVSALLPIVEVGLSPLTFIADLIGKILKAIVAFFSSQTDATDPSELDPFNVLAAGYVFGAAAGAPGVQVPNV